MTPSGLSMLLVIDHVWLCLLIIINGEDIQYIPIVVKSTSKTVGVNLDSIAVCHYPVLLWTREFRPSSFGELQTVKERT